MATVKSAKKTNTARKRTEQRTKIPESLLRAVVRNDRPADVPNAEDFDRLMRYVVFTMAPDHPVYRENPLSKEEIASIEQSCVEKPEWKRLLTDLRVEYDSLLKIFEESSFGTIRPAADKKPVGMRQIWAGAVQAVRRFLEPPVPVPRLALSFGVVLIVCAGVLAGISSAVTPSYYGLTTVDQPTFSVRGTASSLSDGIVRLQEKDYEAAISEFQRLIREEHGSEEALVAGCLEASARLSTARRSLLGLFPSFDRTRVDSAIADLASVLSRLPADGRAGMLEQECRYMLGQAWLMEDNVEKARYEFQLGAKLQGSKRQACRDILQELPVH